MVYDIVQFCYGKKVTVKSCIAECPSLWHPVMNKEKLKRSYWLRSVLWISFSSLTLVVGQQERHPALLHCVPLIYPQVVIFWNKLMKKNVWRSVNSVLPGKRPLSKKVSRGSISVSGCTFMLNRGALLAFGALGCWLGVRKGIRP